MTTVTDYSEFISLHKRYPCRLSNDFLTPGEIRKLIAYGKLRCTADERALFLFERRHGFCKLIFRLQDVSARLAPCGEPLAAFLVYREGSPPETAADWLRGQGFRHAATLLRHTAKKINAELTSDGVGRASADEAYALFSDYFGAAEADMPCRELFESAFCVRSDNGKAAGILYADRQTRLMAVLPEARRRGLARKLYLAYAAGEMEKNQNAVLHEWIRPDNAASLQMFDTLGFTRDGAMADCYLLE